MHERMIESNIDTTFPENVTSQSTNRQTKIEVQHLVQDTISGRVQFLQALISCANVSPRPFFLISAATALCGRCRRRECLEEQVRCQAWRHGALRHPVLQVRQRVPDAGVVLEVKEHVLLDQAPHPHLLLGPPPALQLTAG